MQEFQQVHKNIGRVYEDTFTDISYDHIGDGQISAISPDCQLCTEVYQFGRQLVLRYMSGRIPKQVDTPTMPYDGGATVWFTDGNSIHLSFSAEVAPRPQ